MTEVGAESKLSRERLTEMANAWRVDRSPSSGYLTWAGITKMLADFGAKVEKHTREQCSQEAAYEINKLTGSSGDTLAEAVAARLRGGI